ANGCLLNGSTTINQPTELVHTMTVNNSNCEQPDGSGCVTPSGGAGNYNLTWLFDGSTNNCANGLFAGTYIVAIVDGNLCTDTAFVQVIDQAGPDAAIVSQTNVSCFGLSDGSATVGMVGGTGTFTVQWDSNTGNQTTPTATNLAAGAYAVEITDAVGCVASTYVIITEANALVYIPTSVNPSCFSYCDGSISFAATGGTPPFNYDWRNNANAQIGTGTSVTGLCQGNYILIFSDANGCTNIIPYSLVQPAQVTGTTSFTNVTCFNACNGSASVVPVSGVGPFSYQWNSTPAQTTSTASNLCAGAYTVVLSDNNGCTNTYNYNITQPTQLTTAITLSGNVNCAGACNGFAQANAAGGTAPYSFSWTNGNNSQVNTNMCAGTYVVTVTDANGCTATATVTISEPAPLLANLTSVPNSCYQSCDGSINATVTGGVAPYQLQWFDPMFSTTNAVNNLCAGNYPINVTDANGCLFTGSVAVTQPTILDFSAAISNNAFCNQNNGSICVSVIGGVPPYTYQYNDPAGQNTQCAFNLFSGCYSVQITDGNGCVKDSLLCIIDIPAPGLSIANTTDVTCNGFSDGTIDVLVTGGTAPFTYTWINSSGTPLPGQGTSNATTGLPGGTFGLIVVDSASCVSAITEFIFEPNILFSAVTSQTIPSCFNYCDGTATVSTSGGTAPYSYLWDSGVSFTNALNNGLCQGTHNVVVTDANGCVANATTTMGQPTPLVVSNAALTNVTCFGFCNGYIDLAVSGATPPYFYNWTGGVSTGPTAAPLCPGSYGVIITDVNGCIVAGNNIITEPLPLNGNIIAGNSTCSDCNAVASINMSGGTQPYTYSWINGLSPTDITNTGLCAGNTGVTVTDNNGCLFSTTGTVIDLPSPQVTSTSFTEPSCSGFNNGTATVASTGGTAPINYSWNTSPVQNTQTAINLTSGNYCVTVSDVNNCSVTSCLTVTQPQPLQAFGDFDVTICYGDSTQLWAAGAGGVQPYTYNWQSPGFNGSGPILVNPLSTTTYCFTVTDDRGCVTPPECITIIVNPPLEVDLTPSQTICSGAPTTLNAQATGGNGGPYNFVWTDEFGTSYTPTQFGNNSSITVNPTVPTWYYVVLDDGCSIPYIDSVLLSINPLPIAFLNAVDTAGCSPFTAQFILNTDIGTNFSYDFDCDGVADYVGNVANATYTYTTPGSYDVCVVVTSAAGCTTAISQTQMIDVFPVPEADFLTTPTSTSILSPSIAMTDQSQGSPVLYSWNFGDGNTITGLPGGIVPDNTHGGNTIGTIVDPIHMYTDTGYFDITLTITNQYGCIDQATYQVYIEGDYIIFMPNTFTPNGDGKNDVFIPVGVMFGSEGYELMIFNRWGELLFESRNADTGWDGTHQGVLCKQDVYVWKVKAVDHNGITHDYIGHITLLR
ncbi:MAG TPA: gliding motility-associated C-terminal domain-containing protein, partial [Flavobacteriales bacterium]|nr:gliding motility-associated C-terminal domain-containing protein [Flavobacteriales bacterium]